MVDESSVNGIEPQTKTMSRATPREPKKILKMSNTEPMTDATVTSVDAKLTTALWMM